MRKDYSTLQGQNIPYLRNKKKGIKSFWKVRNNEYIKYEFKVLLKKKQKTREKKRKKLKTI